MMNGQEELNRLIHELRKHDELYSENKTIITDSDYDDLYFKAIELFKNQRLDDDGYFEDVKDDLKTNTLKSVKHLSPMLSLDKTREKEGIIDFLKKFSNDKKSPFYTDSFVTELKEDGLTIVMYFNRKDLDSDFIAVTRGGGYEGQDVTASFQKYKNILSKLDGKELVIRGEAVINDINFERIDKLYPGVYSSKRNAISGIVGRKDIDQSLVRMISYYPYNIENINDYDNINTQKEQLDYMESLGFEITHLQKYFKNTNEGHEQLADFITKDFNESERAKVGHVIDGLVIKPNILKTIDAMGSTGHHPNNMLAYKFKAEEEIAILKKVIWQESANGRLTPVGVLDHPVTLAEASIQRASLASMQNIEARDLMLNDHVIIRRSNDVIPQITSSLKELRDGTQEKIGIPNDAYREGALVFTNHPSKGALISRWAKFIDKQHLNIDGFSGRAIDSLSNADLIDLNDFSSLWKIDHDKFIEIDGLGEKSWSKLQESLENAKYMGLQRVLLSLPIDQLGGMIVDKIVDWRNDFNQVINSNLTLYEIRKDLTKFLEDEKGFGQKKVEVALKVLDDENVKQLKNLSSVGVPLKKIGQKEQTKVSDKLDGKTFAITGRLNRASRKDLEKVITENGGSVSGKINDKTTYLINNDIESKSSKNKKAKELGIDIINEDIFYSFL